jgi:hypothetical protein
LTCAG